MIKREAKFGILFRHWIKKHPRLSGAFELKQVGSNSFPFAFVPEHQLDALMAAKTTGILYKAPDDSIGVKPFDYFYLRDAPAYVVVRYPAVFCLIDVETFIKERDTSDRKSLTSKRAREISITNVDL